MSGEELHMARYLDPREAARILGVHEKTVRRMLNDGRLKGIQIGRQWRIPPEWLPHETPPRPPRRERAESPYQRAARRAAA